MSVVFVILLTTDGQGVPKGEQRLIDKPSALMSFYTCHTSSLFMKSKSDHPMIQGSLTFKHRLPSR
ncbi:Uncharacterized protein APZ42_030697 [Daphnia magna]|uniref:Uncharacterized protein n=1 Tax=Daphnia magna TaxID=35525 RepID=A0A164NHG6_9CRUS|nr:Uncharacterized protein APZ42_030697 [Daphnia magna]